MRRYDAPHLYRLQPQFYCFPPPPQFYCFPPPPPQFYCFPPPPPPQFYCFPPPPPPQFYCFPPPPPPPQFYCFPPPPPPQFYSFSPPPPQFYCFPPPPPQFYCFPPPPPPQFYCFPPPPPQFYCFPSFYCSITTSKTIQSTTQEYQCHLNLVKCCLHFIFVRAEQQTFKRDEETLHPESQIIRRILKTKLSKKEAIYRLFTVLDFSRDMA